MNACLQEWIVIYDFSVVLLSPRPRTGLKPRVTVKLGCRINQIIFLLSHHFHDIFDFFSAKIPVSVWENSSAITTERPESGLQHHRFDHYPEFAEPLGKVSNVSCGGCRTDHASCPGTCVVKTCYRAKKSGILLSVHGAPLGSTNG